MAPHGVAGNPFRGARFQAPARGFGIARGPGPGAEADAGVAFAKAVMVATPLHDLEKEAAGPGLGVELELFATVFPVIEQPALPQCAQCVAGQIEPGFKIIVIVVGDVQQGQAVRLLPPRGGNAPPGLGADGDLTAVRAIETRFSPAPQPAGR